MEIKSFINGKDIDISDFSTERLHRLHYDQEISYTNAIKNTPPYSIERANYCMKDMN